jgi:hypothetical protein
MVHPNLLPVIVSAIVVFVLGWLWYSPLLFYKTWMRLRGLDPVAAMANAKMPMDTVTIELVRCLILAYMVSSLVMLLGVHSFLGAVHFGSMMWVTFPVLILAGSVLWEKAPLGVAAIHAGDWLVKLLVIPIIVTLWR